MYSATGPNRNGGGQRARAALLEAFLHRTTMQRRQPMAAEAAWSMIPARSSLRGDAPGRSAPAFQPGSQGCSVLRLG
jgi:hypothetical protein